MPEQKPPVVPAIALLLGTVLLLVHPCRVLLAELYVGKAQAVLDDPDTGYRDMREISADSLPFYREAIAALQRAAALVPSHARYQYDLAGLALRLGTWAGALEGMGEPAPDGAIPKREAIAMAVSCLKAAVALQPFNPDHHLALGQLYDRIDDGTAKKEYALAVQAAPVNAALRYTIAMRHLLRGDRTEALRHAAILSAMDDSYRIPDPARKRSLMERRTTKYLLLLSNSYLFKALEIAWRASDKDIAGVKRLVPADDEAQAVWRLFLESKDVEDPGTDPT